MSIVSPKLLPTKAGKGFNPANTPSLKKDVKLTTAIAHKYSKNKQNTINVIKSFGDTLNFILTPPFVFPIIQ